ncbi:MAG TPA: HupE/UreJ family protein [Vicinamibacterales bacterium]|nr:HupE/UreJ family protein [Vicinamibacterales bacterium]
MTTRRSAVIATLLLAFTAPVWADVFRPAYLELRQKDDETFDVMWKVPARGETMRLAIHVTFPDGTNIVSPPRSIFIDDAFVERWTVRRPGGLARGRVSIEGLPGGITDVLARVERSDGTTQVARLLPAEPSFVVEAPAVAAGVAWTYTVLGVEHILAGIDHLLYILAMLFLVKGWKRIVATLSAFTATHSVTLTAAALGWVHVPQPPVEACIALSIVFVAREVVETRRGRPGLTARWPWVVAFTFGLMHGFGFAGALAEVGLPTRAIPVALLFFNVGVEIGQLLFVAAALAAMATATRVASRWPRWVEAVPSYVIGAIAMFWVVERVTAFVNP